MSGLDSSRHPCFNPDARHSAGRVHLPVAPACNIKCNYCNRAYDCVNESRPGVTSAVLSPEQAVYYLDQVMEQRPDTAVAGIAGPGDPFADPARTLATLAAVRRRFPDLLLCVSTNGLNLRPYVGDLQDLAVTHVTVTVNTIAPDVGAKIYSWVRRGKQVSRGRAAAHTLIDSQLEALEALSSAGLTVKLNCILIPGVNEACIAEVARAAAELGASTFNIMPMHPVAGTPFGTLPYPDPAAVDAVRRSAGRFLPQVSHCARCRADAVGLLGEAHNETVTERLARAASWHPDGDSRPDCAAIATMEGLLVSEHLGQAATLAIYKRQEDGSFSFCEHRKTPEPGAGSARWKALADTLADCSVVLAASAGSSPQAVLSEYGIRVVEWAGLIEDALQTLARGEIPRSARRLSGCGVGCAGAGEGC